MTVYTRFTWNLAIVVIIGLGVATGAPDLLAQSGLRGLTVPVQIPYEMPPPFQETAPAVTVPPNAKPLTPEELQRAESLLPMLEGKQEFWAMGEFVHLGEPSVPVLVKALKMPGPRSELIFAVPNRGSARLFSSRTSRNVVQS